MGLAWLYKSCYGTLSCTRFLLCTASHCSYSCRNAIPWHPPPPPHASVWFCKPLFVFLMKRTLLLVFICLYIGWYFIVPLTCQYYLVMSYLLPHCTTEAMFDNKCDLLLNLKYFGDHEDSNFQKADYIKLKSAYPELLYRKLDFILANNACLWER